MFRLPGGGGHGKNGAMHALPPLVPTGAIGLRAAGQVRVAMREKGVTGPRSLAYRAGHGGHAITRTTGMKGRSTKGGRRPPTTPTEQYQQWKRYIPAVGCVFARLLAAAPDRYGQQLEVITDSTAEAVADQIEVAVDKAVSATGIAALTLLLPNVKDLRVLVGIALALEGKPRWQVTRTPLTKTPVGAVLAFGVTRNIPAASGNELPSELLVLGDFSAFPATRRAPVTAIEMFVGAVPVHGRNGKAAVKANLDLVDVEPPNQDVFDRTWEATRAARLKSLGGIDDPRAKARVSFVVPMTTVKNRGRLP